MHNRNTNKATNYKKFIDLDTEFVKDVKAIVNQVRIRNRSTEQKIHLIKRLNLKLLKSYQERNKRKYTLSQIKYIMFKLKTMKEYGKSKFFKTLFIPKKELIEFLETSKIDLKTIDCEINDADKIQFKKLQEFKKKHGID